MGSAEAAPAETQGAGASPTKDLKVLIGNFISNFILEMPYVHLYFLPQTPVGVFYHLLAINSTKVVLFLGEVPKLLTSVECHIPAVTV